jgi:nucleobase transporter 1/2
LQWGPPTFNADHAFGMMAAVMVSLIEVPWHPRGRHDVSFTQKIFYPSDFVEIIWVLQTTGAFKAAARLASATPPPAYVLSRGIGWQVSGYILLASYRAVNMSHEYQIELSVNCLQFHRFSIIS